MVPVSMQVQEKNPEIRVQQELDTKKIKELQMKYLKFPQK